MGIFKIKDQNRNQQITETDYFKWLKSTEQKNIHFSKTKVEYLEQQGFQIGVDFISEYEIQTLNLIEMFYFQTIIKPMLNQYVVELI